MINSDFDSSAYKLSPYGRKVLAKLLDVLKDRTEWLSCNEIAELIGEPKFSTKRWLANFRESDIVEFKPPKAHGKKGYWRLKVKNEDCLTKN